jgi:hypothetical protein
MSMLPFQLVSFYNSCQLSCLCSWNNLRALQKAEQTLLFPTPLPQQTKNFHVFCRQTFGFTDLTGKTSLRPGRHGIEIDGLDRAPLVIADADEVGEVLARHVALFPDAERVPAARVELLDRALEADPQRIGREAKDLPDGAGDTRAVDVGVVHGGQLGGDLGAEPVR